MNLQYKNFLLGMLLAVAPTFIWANHQITTSNQIKERKVSGVSALNTDTASYDYFHETLDTNSKTIAYDLNIKDDEPEPTPTSLPTFAPLPTATPKPVAIVASQEKIKQEETTVVYTAPEEIGSMIDRYATEYGADPNMMKKIAKCESGYDPNAVSSSGAYHGLYQFVATTWISNRNAMGLDPNLELRKDPEEAIKTAAFKMGRDGYGAWPVCSKI